MLVQEFIESRSFSKYGIEGPHDFRVILVDDDPVEAYFRVPKEGLIANVAQGGSLRYVELEDISDKVLVIIDEVKEIASKLRPNFYSVDFMFDVDNRPWVVELNSKPGIGFHMDIEKEEYERPAMEKVVEGISELV